MGVVSITGVYQPAAACPASCQGACRAGCIVCKDASFIAIYNADGSCNAATNLTAGVVATFSGNSGGTYAGQNELNT